MTFFPSRDRNQYLEQTTDSVITTLTANAQCHTASSGKHPQGSPAGSLHLICCPILHHQRSLFAALRAWTPPTPQLPHTNINPQAKPPLLFFCSLQCVSGAEEMQGNLTLDILFCHIYNAFRRAERLRQTQQPLDHHKLSTVGWHS